MLITILKVEEVITEGPLKSSYGEKEYFKWVLKGEGSEYIQYVPSLLSCIVKEGDIVKIAYEVVTKQQGNQRYTNNQIIGLQIEDTQNMKPVTTSQTTTSKTTQDTSNFFQLKGKAFYAHLKEPNTKGNYPSNKYQLDLSISEKTKEKLESLGVQIKNNPDRPEMGNFVRLKANKQPKVLDSSGEIIQDIPLVGNGSDVIVSVNMYDNRESNAKAGKGGLKCLGVFEVRIENLVPYGNSLKLLEE